MSRTSLIGALGLAKQSTKGTAGTTFRYLPATSININAQQVVNTLPPEIGGSYFLRESYKGGVSVGGDAGLVMRADGMGDLLQMLCGAPVSVANLAGGPAITTPVAAPTPTAGAGSTSLGAGVYTVGYTFSNGPVNPTAGGVGETAVSTTATVTLTAGQQINVASIAFPTNATQINWYVSLAAGNTTVGYVTSFTTAGAQSLTQYGSATYSPAPAINSTGGSADGSYTHTFNPFAPAAGVDLPWYTLNKDVAKLYAEQFVDTKLASLQIDVAKQTVGNVSASFFGITPSEIAVPTETGLFDVAGTFQNCLATIALTDEANVITFPASASQAERVSFNFTNQLSQDEFAVGSYYPIDVTLLQRTATISYDLVIRDPSLIRAVYRNGGTSAWSPTIVRGALTVVMNSPKKIASSQRAFSLQIIIPGMDFMMMPVQMSGSQLIRANLSTQVTLGPSGADQFTFKLINDVVSY